MKVNVSSRAQRDLQRLYIWLEDKDASAARRAIDAISEGILSLGDLPERGRRSPLGGRELRVKFGRAGYVLRYRVLKGEVIITRIFHGRELRS